MAETVYYVYFAPRSGAVPSRPELCRLIEESIERDLPPDKTPVCRALLERGYLLHNVAAAECIAPPPGTPIGHESHVLFLCCGEPRSDRPMAGRLLATCAASALLRAHGGFAVCANEGRVLDEHSLRQRLSTA